jgi:hypothetical protein
MRLLDLASPQLALVFCATKQMRTDLAGELQSRGYRAEALHGDMTQEQRESVMDAPRGGRLEEHAEAALVAQVDRVLVGGEWRPFRPLVEDLARRHDPLDLAAATLGVAFGPARSRQEIPTGCASPKVSAWKAGRSPTVVVGRQPPPVVQLEGFSKYRITI